jgi:hypothetical protein
MNKLDLMTYVLPGLIIAVFVLAFWPIMQKLSMRWEGGDNNYCYLVVPLFTYLLWDRRERGSEFRVQSSATKVQRSGFRV